MAIEWSPVLFAVLSVGLVVGALLASLVRRRAGRADRERSEQLEAELEQTREELEVHREDVARHFHQTSDLFRGVTEQYTRLYAHLATGARAFSTEEVPALGQLDRTLIGDDFRGGADEGESEDRSETESAAPAPRSNGGGAGASTP